MRLCKLCGSSGPFYIHRRALRDGDHRLETSTLCKECEKRKRRERYARSRPTHYWDEDYYG